jgi:hypothetical protein
MIQSKFALSQDITKHHFMDKNDSPGAVTIPLNLKNNEPSRHGTTVEMKHEVNTNELDKNIHIHVHGTTRERTVHSDPSTSIHCNPEVMPP